MDHRTFFDELKKGNIASCYVFEGPEEYIKRSAMDALRKKLLPEGMEEMNESRLRDPDANTIIAAAETLPSSAVAQKYSSCRMVIWHLHTHKVLQKYQLNIFDYTMEIV